MRKVDWHEHGDDDEGDDDGGGLDFGFDNTWAPGWDSYWGAEPSYYYNPPVVVSKASSPAKVYISSEQKSKPFYWYYCKSARRYYPYVSQCPGGWTKVAPRPSKN